MKHTHIVCVTYKQNWPMQTVIDFQWNLFTVTVSCIDCYRKHAIKNENWRHRNTNRAHWCTFRFGLNRSSNKHLDLRSTLLNKWWRHYNYNNKSSSKNWEIETIDQPTGPRSIVPLENHIYWTGPTSLLAFVYVSLCVCVCSLFIRVLCVCWIEYFWRLL